MAVTNEEILKLLQAWNARDDRLLATLTEINTRLTKQNGSLARLNEIVQSHSQKLDALPCGDQQTRLRLVEESLEKTQVAWTSILSFGANIVQAFIIAYLVSRVIQ